MEALKAAMAPIEANVEKLKTEASEIKEQISETEERFKEITRSVREMEERIAPLEVSTKQTVFLWKLLIFFLAVSKLFFVIKIHCKEIVFDTNIKTPYLVALYSYVKVKQYIGC